MEEEKKEETKTGEPVPELPNAEGKQTDAETKEDTTRRPVSSSKKDSARRSTARSGSAGKGKQGERKSSARGKKGGKKGKDAKVGLREMDFSIEGAKQPPPGTSPLMLSLREMVDWGILESTEQKMDEIPQFSSVPLEQVEANVEKAGKLSPFHRIKHLLPKYREDPGKEETKEEEEVAEDGEDYIEKLLLIRDPDQKYGENFLICLAPNVAREHVNQVYAKERAEREAREEEERKKREEEERLRREEEEINNRVVEDLPMIPNESYSSQYVNETQNEVTRLSPKSTRPRIKICLRRALKDFGVKYGFNDRDAEQGIVEFKQRKDPNFNVRKHEQDIGLQACVGSLSGYTDKSCQTIWDRKINASIQTTTTAVGEDPTSDKKDSYKKTEEQRKIRDFLDNVLPQIEYALSQNETLNIYEDELTHMNDDDVALISNQGENSLREVRTFMDLQLSNGKALSAIDWHPRIPKWVATAAYPQQNFEEWLKESGKVHFSHVIVFTLSEFSSQIVLQSPSPITCFRWNPTTPTTIVTGAENGQVMLFDLSPATDKLAKKQKRPSSTEGESKGGESSSRAIVVKPTSVSSLESSHRGSVIEIMWLPPHATMHPRSKAFQQSDNNKCVQFASAGRDGRIAVWDSRFKEQARQAARRRSVDLQPSQGNIVGVAGEMHIIPPPETQWHPIYECQCQQGTDKVHFTSVSWNAKAPSEPLLALTEEGYFVCTDWAPRGHGTDVYNYIQKESFVSSTKQEENKEAEEGETNTEAGVGAVLWSVPDHFRPGTCVHRSPFLDDIILSVGDWNFSLWKKGIQCPIFKAPDSASMLTCASWSPTRPAVLFLGRSDGVIDVWDFTDTALKPSRVIPVVSSAVSSIQFRTIGTEAAPYVSSDSQQAVAAQEQLLAIGDAKGSLHVVEVPISLVRSFSNEKSQVKDILRREVERVKWYAVRFQKRNKEAQEAERARQAEESRRESQKAARENALNQLRAQLPNGDDWTEEELLQEQERRKLQKQEEQYQKFEKKMIKQIEELKQHGDDEENLEEDSKSTS